MDDLSTTPVRGFTVVLRGQAGPTVLAAFDEFEVSVECDMTLIRGIYADQAALFGVLERVQKLGLEVVSVEQAKDAR
jgi:hypothetical protein